ncbi:MAG: VanZ family protein [Clostridia bacterium]|nr:VanZ family protein [Clostridia bacterium]
MADLMELIKESIPFALGFTVIILLIAFLLFRLLLQKRIPIFWTVAGCVYLGFLLAGTLRPGSIQELVEWTDPRFMNITYQLDIGDSVSSLHGLFNIALFLPWGIIGMIMGRKPFSALPCLLSSVLMAFFIETYQLFHWRSFDFGDIVTNILGCAIGIIIMLPFTLYRHMKQKHSR